MRKPREPRRVSVSVRLTEATAHQLRDFVRYHSGHPLYLELGPFVERAVLAEIQRTELLLSGALPAEDRIARPVQRPVPINCHRRTT